MPQWQSQPNLPRGESREISYILVGSGFAYRSLGATTAESVDVDMRVGGAELARIGKDPASKQEAAVVDSLIKKLRPFDTKVRPFDRPFVSERASAVGARPLSRMRPIGGPMRPGAVWACVALGVLLGIALPQWPYARACGWWLLLYLTAVGTVVVAGAWGARVSWKSRIGLAHIVAVGTMIWGLALTADEVLPRVGYAKTRLAWRCHDGQAAAPSLTSLFALTRRLDAGTADLVR